MKQWFVGLTALVVVVAAAGVAGAQSTTTPPTTAPKTTTPTTPATTATRGVTATSIKVGGVGYSYVYGGADVGARARFQRANDSGGVNGRTIDYLGFADDGGDPAAGTTAVTKAVEQDGVLAVVPAVTPDFGAASYLTGAKVPYFGWALSSDFCGNSGAIPSSRGDGGHSLSGSDSRSRSRVLAATGKSDRFSRDSTASMWE